MKTEVYSWRVSPELKSELEREARRRNLSLSAVLELAASEWLSKRNEDPESEQRQRLLRRSAEKWFGSFAGDDPARSKRTRDLVRERLRRKHGR